MLDPSLDMTTQRIVIAGAGLAGLALGRCLKARNISAVIFESHDGKPRNNYSINLYHWAYEPLLHELDVDAPFFQRNFEIRPVGSVSNDVTKESPESSERLRCHRGDLERWLGQGLDIRWGQKVDDIELKPSAVHVKIRNKVQPLLADTLVAADGVHSQIRKRLATKVIRKILPEVLPYVVFNGRRMMAKEQYDSTIGPYMQNGTLSEYKHGSTLLNIVVDRHGPRGVMINYTYSRPAKVEDDDRLYTPDRPPETAGVKAQNVWNDLESELARMNGLPPIFTEIFDINKMKNDRILNWLMRSVRPCIPELQTAAEHGVVLIGDAAHAMPILGGRGANSAIQDAVKLARILSQPGLPDYKRFIDDSYNSWMRNIRESEQRLLEMHAM